MTAPDPAVQAESTGGLSEEQRLAKWLFALACDPDREIGLDLDDRSAANDLAALLVDRFAAVQAREVAEARADERERTLREFGVLVTRDHNRPREMHGYSYGNGWWDAANHVGALAARLARAGGEGE